MRARVRRRWALDKLGLNGLALGLRAAVLGSVLLLTACFTAPSADGPYRCTDGNTCPDGFLCDDGLCCVPFGEPRCTTLVLDGGVCANGESVKKYYLDKDGDGYGGINSEKSACALPHLVPEDAPGAKWIEQGGDCLDDDPTVHPMATELCDELDNDCNGEVDDQLALTDYWPDRDNDGFGDSSANPLSRCGPSAGFVANAKDCNDNDATQSPMGVELCNRRDDNCNGNIDDDPVDTGGHCLDTARIGACQQGMIACWNGALICAQNRNAQGAQLYPKTERCDGIDSDCNGTIDEQPGCGGPTNLKTDPDSSFGAKVINYPSGNANLDTCLKPRAGTAESFNGTTWTGLAGGTHVAWIENSSGWDLRKPNLALHLKFTVKLDQANGTFNGFNQPQILLCGANGEFVRYRPLTTLLSGNSISVDEKIPLVGDGKWFPVLPSTDLNGIHRIEIAMQPAFTSPQPSFTLTLQAAGFEVLP